MKKQHFFWPLMLLCLLIVFLVFWIKEGMLPVDKNDSKPVIFVINQGESITTIAKKLESERLIRNKIVFFLLIKKLGIEKKIQAGDYRLYRTMDAQTLAMSLTHGTLDVWVTLLEGWRKEEAAQVFSKSHNISELIFIQKAKEGYLFPDTYLIPTEADVNTILSIIQKNFKNKVTPAILKQAEKKGFSEEELLTLASLIERETKNSADRRLVGGVILNRLKEGMPLQIDASVQYALGYDEKGKTWWKKRLSEEDLAIPSLYNTYLNNTLPPGPICSPGLDSIMAVLEAQNSDYLFYISDKQGKMHYATTLEEHNRNIKAYLD